MADVTIDEIRQQEEELFEAECSKLTGGMRAKTKALQQLAVSEDSPFNLTGSTRPQQQALTIDREQIRIRDEKARLLREETEEIKKQLDLVKSHLNEFNLVGANPVQLHATRDDVCCCSRQKQQQCRRFECNAEVQCVQGHKCDQQCQTDCLGGTTNGQTRSQPTDSLTGFTRQQEENHVINQQRTSADSQFYHNATSKLPDGPASFAPNDTQVNPTKFRPLTGKTDCPNCVCDRRRSVCDKCIVLQKNVVLQQSSDQKQLADSATGESNRQPSLLTEQKLIRLNSALQRDGTQANDGIETGQSKGNHDERPIRPAKKNLDELLREQTAVESNATTMIGREVDQVVVPNTIYTIGKSLNDKRTKLAQAIQELQNMTERVRKRGDRLEQERQVAKLYRDQWKFGPQIGGGAKSASRESLKASSSRGGTNSANYLSRLDPNLARDTKSMMGFQHVEPTLKLRQHDKSAGSQSSSSPPKPMPRFSKLGANSRPVVLVARGNYRRPTQSSALHSRSKSLESLTRQTPRLAAVGTRPRQQAQDSLNKTTATKRASGGPQQRPKTPVINGISRAKSSSEVNLVPESRVEDDTLDSLSGQAVEENLEDELREDELESLRSDTELQGESLSDEPRDMSPSKGTIQLDEPSQTSPASRADLRRDEMNGAMNSRPEQRGWIPVFGETEIKTVNRRAPERKVIVINGSTRGLASTRRQPGMRAQATNSTTRSILRTGANTTAKHLLGSASARTRTGPENDSVLNEARKKLQFATDLLETDQLDSRTRNQLIVKRQQSSTARPANPLRARPARMSPMNSDPMQGMGPTQRNIGARSRTTSSDESPTTTTTTTTTDTAHSSILSANKEISRLESMISEQQKLLLKLASGADQNYAEHVSSSPCSNCRCATSSPCCGRTRQTGRQLINHLRDRLNKTRTRLARTLEEERAKHKRLEQRFDSSLRKQSDLEAENELLKRSLSKCIDTCLKDISNTFESLSEHLNESARGIEADDRTASPSSLNGPNLNRAKTGGLSRSSSSGGGDDDCGTPSLTNAAQLIADNNHLKRMKLHIDTIEEQRRGIFEELRQERDRSQQLELELQQSKLELDQLIEAKQRLETQLHTHGANPVDREIEMPTTKNDLGQEQGADSRVGLSEAENKSLNQKSTQVLDAGGNETDSSQCQQQLMSENSLPSDDPTSMTFSSIDMYRQFIQSMTPDFDGIRRERRMILNEFDNIKRMLSDMEI